MAGIKTKQIWGCPLVRSLQNGGEKLGGGGGLGDAGSIIAHKAKKKTSFYWRNRLLKNRVGMLVIFFLKPSSMPIYTPYPVYIFIKHRKYRQK